MASGPAAGIWDLAGCGQPPLCLRLGDCWEVLTVQWGGIPRRAPQPGEHAHTGTHTRLCVRAARTPARVPALPCPSSFPASHPLSACSCRSWGAGLWLPPSDPPSLGCSSPGLALRLLGTCRPPPRCHVQPGLGGRGVHEPHVEDGQRRPLRLGPPRHTPPSYSCSILWRNPPPRPGQNRLRLRLRSGHGCVESWSRQPLRTPRPPDPGAAAGGAGHGLPT